MTSAGASLNFGEPGLVRETEAGLRELGLGEIANYFVEAHAIVNPAKPDIKEAEDYYQCLESRGLMDRINELDGESLSSTAESRWQSHLRRLDQVYSGAS